MKNEPVGTRDRLFTVNLVIILFLSLVNVLFTQAFKKNLASKNQNYISGNNILKDKQYYIDKIKVLVS